MTTSIFRTLTLVVALASLCGTAVATDVSTPLPVNPTGDPTNPYTFYEPYAWAEDTFTLQNSTATALQGRIPEVHTQANIRVPVPVWQDPTSSFQVVPSSVGSLDGIVAPVQSLSQATSAYTPTKYKYPDENPTLPVISVQAAIRTGDDSVSIGFLNNSSGTEVNSVMLTLNNDGTWTLNIPSLQSTPYYSGNLATELGTPFSPTAFYGIRLEWNVVTNSIAAFVTTGTWRYDPSTLWVFTGINPSDGSDTENMIPNIPLPTLTDYPAYDAFGFQFAGPDLYDGIGTYDGAALDNFSAVSEPQSIALLGFGTVGLSWYGFSRRKNRLRIA